MREMVVRAIETDKKDIPEMVDDVYMTFSYVTLFKVVKQQILMASATNYPEVRKKEKTFEARGC